MGFEPKALAVTDSPINETAQWKTQYTIEIQQTSGGGITVSQAGPWYDAGSTVTLIATPDSSHAFSSWLVNGKVVSYSTTYTATMDSPMQIWAKFIPIQTTTSSAISSTSSSSTQSSTFSSTVTKSSSSLTTTMGAAGILVFYAAGAGAMAVLIMLVVMVLRKKTQAKGSYLRRFEPLFRTRV